MSAYQDFRGREILNVTGHAICLPQKKDLSFILDGSSAQPVFAPDICIDTRGRLGFASRYTERQTPDSSVTCGVRMVHTSQVTDLVLRFCNDGAVFVPHPMCLYIVSADVAAMLLLKGAKGCLTSDAQYLLPSEFSVAVPVDLEPPKFVGGPMRAKYLQVFDVKQ